MNRLAVGLGSNLGDRLRALRRAIDRLERSGVSIEACSDVFETPPWGVDRQPLFLNACAVICTDLNVIDLLLLIKWIEEVEGRTKRDRWGPREIDIDILIYRDDFVYFNDNIKVPHPHLAERAFVLLPLSQIASQWVHPSHNQTILQLMLQTDISGIERITVL